MRRVRAESERRPGEGGGGPGKHHGAGGAGDAAVRHRPGGLRTGGTGN